jgi:transaldolase
VLQLLFRSEPVTYDGSNVTLRDAVLAPAPERPPPMWVGGKGGPRLLRLAARFADGWNTVWRVAPEGYARNVADVRAACDVFLGVYDASAGVDGLVSLEVAPTLAHDTAGTVHEAERLWQAVDRPNAMIKIPGTKAGLGAITHCLAAGINVNVTLLFAVERYAEVVEAFFAGISQRVDAGLPVQSIASVASFFVSRVDGKVDPILDRQTPNHPLRGKAAIANACAAYRLFEWSLGRPQWDRLAKAGAQPQRPLWASTSTKDPCYADVYYVEALVAPRTVNTLPPETFAAYRDHGNPAIRIHDGVATSATQLKALAAAGVDLAGVTRELEEEGIDKFAASYRSLLAGIGAKVGQLAGSRAG